MTLPSQYTQLKDTLETAFENRANFTATTVEPVIKDAITTAIELLDKGELRIAEKTDGQWQVHQWLKKAVLLYFKTHDNALVEAGYTNFYDKVPLKYTGMEASQMAALGSRVVPHAIVRKGAFVAANCILMPSYINMGAYVDTGTMIDTWATVGSCAQIGKNVHLSGGAGIGGVLEPLQANPTIIEDNCFIGARSEIVDGVIIETGSVIGMGVFISASTRIYNRMTGEISYGRVPAGSVVVSGSIPAADGSHSLYCAVIVKQVDENTRAKTSLNELLRL